MSGKNRTSPEKIGPLIHPDMSGKYGTGPILSNKGAFTQTPASYCATAAMCQIVIIENQLQSAGGGTTEMSGCWLSGGGWSYIFRTLNSTPFFPDKTRYHRIFTLSGLFRTCQAPGPAAEVDPIAHFGHFRSHPATCTGSKSRLGSNPFPQFNSNSFTFNSNSNSFGIKNSNSNSFLSIPIPFYQFSIPF